MKCALWLNYSLTRAVLWFADMYAEHGIDIDTRAHVLVIGPLGFAVMWKHRKPATTPDAGQESK